MVFFVFELIHFFRKEVWDELQLIITTGYEFNDDQLSKCRPLLAVLNLRPTPILPRVDRQINRIPMDKFVTPIDLAPYCKNQCFRLLGCGKNGCYRLHKWDGNSEVIGSFRDFQCIVDNPGEMVNSLVTGVGVQFAVESRSITPKVLSPHNFPRRSAIDALTLSLFGAAAPTIACRLKTFPR